MISSIRTDLALESRQIFRESRGGSEEIEGLRFTAREKEGFALSLTEVLDRRGEAALGKPKGRYLSFEADGLLRREQDAFPRACRVLAQELRRFLDFPSSANILVVGLGNREITPDAIGPLAVEYTMVTRHLREKLPRHFGAFRPVSAVCSGVLGTTGIESGDIVAALCEKVKPSAVVVIDALAARSMARLCRTVQIADTGIVPGSGVGNARLALNRESLGVPVIAVGVPTVVDAATLAEEFFGADGTEAARRAAAGMMVTPRDIDRSVRDMAKLVGYSLNLALHDGLSIEDVDMFLS